LTAAESAARSVVLGLVRRLRAGQLTIVEGARRLVFGEGSPQAMVCVRFPRAWPLLLHGSRGLAEGYINRLWDSPDLTALIRVAARNVSGLDVWRRRVAPLRVPWHFARGLRGRNTRAGSRDDIAAHYDLGNDLFSLMLDETMMYSCAYFPQREMTLGKASLAKLELICNKLGLSSRDHLVEIGTGWGGLAVHAASTRGCRVTTTTISREQYEYARSRVAAAGLGDRVTVVCEDYRDLRGHYDKLVSVEMIEAVGWRDFGTYFDRCSRLLRGDGNMLLQAIVIDDRAYEVEKTSPSFIRNYIFPNGCLPSLEVIGRCLASHTDLQTTGLEDLTSHYVQTLRRWRGNFEAASAQLAELGYDERFQRLWKLYLSYCEGGFAERRIGVVQMEMAKPGWRGSVGSSVAGAVAV
jgi:cyclopropane-fatty-acyl-phospholipid synthase